MISDEMKETMKKRLKDYVNMITEPDRRAGHNKYKCPFCKSGWQPGSGHNGAFSITDDGLSWKCFSCNQGGGGDIFALVGEYEGIPGKEHFNEQAQRIAEIFGYDIGGTAGHIKKAPIAKKAPTAKETPTTEKAEAPAAPAPTGRYKKDIEYWHAMAYEYIKLYQGDPKETDYFTERGFGKDIIESFNLGFDVEEEAIVIPYDREGSYYIRRYINENAPKRYWKPPRDEAGEEPVYNKAALYKDKPCFVCEGQIDAISIIAAGEGAVSAVSVGGSGSTKLEKQIKAKKPTATLILSFDNDEPGAKATADAAAKLKEAGVAFTIADYSLEAYPQGQRKDANDFFRANRAQLAADIKANVEKAETAAAIKADEEKAQLAAEIEAHEAKRGTERLKDFINGIKEGANTPYTPTKFKKLDEYLDGGFYPGLYILGAISSLGKTTLLVQIADQIAAQGKDVLYFTLEMGANELIAKSISRQTYNLCKRDNLDMCHAKTARGITTASRYADYLEEDKELINNAIAAYGQYAGHLYYYEGVGDIGVEGKEEGDIKVKGIKDYVEDHIKLTGNTPFIFIDYLQILAPYNPRASDKQNTDKAVLELKRLSRDLKTSVVCISSFNRDNYVNEVSMQAFKESGAIEYCSDVLLGLQPQNMEKAYNDKKRAENATTVDSCKKKGDRDVEIKVLKNRHGKTNVEVQFTYHSLFNIFEEDEDQNKDQSKDQENDGGEDGDGFEEIEDGETIPFGDDRY